MLHCYLTPQRDTVAWWYFIVIFWPYMHLHVMSHQFDLTHVFSRSNMSDWFLCCLMAYQSKWFWWFWKNRTAWTLVSRNLEHMVRLLENMLVQCCSKSHELLLFPSRVVSASLLSISWHMSDCQSIQKLGLWLLKFYKSWFAWEPLLSISWPFLSTWIMDISEPPWAFLEPLQSIASKTRCFPF